MTRTTSKVSEQKEDADLMQRTEQLIAAAQELTSALRVQTEALNAAIDIFAKTYVPPDRGTEKD